MRIFPCLFFTNFLTRTNLSKSMASIEGATTNSAERAEAADMRSGGGSSESHSFKGCFLAPALIDEGTQKYVLIRAEYDGNVNLLVRGNARAEYHKDAARRTVSELQAASIRYEILGGGRIRHISTEKSIHVYGFSYGFPWKAIFIFVLFDACSY